jgi:hypothetical protein
MNAVVVHRVADMEEMLMMLPPVGAIKGTTIFVP